jgi:hypothetical protein
MNTYPLIAILILVSIQLANPGQAQNLEELEQRLISQGSTETSLADEENRMRGVSDPGQPPVEAWVSPNADIESYRNDMPRNLSELAQFAATRSQPGVSAEELANEICNLRRRILFGDKTNALPSPKPCQKEE